MPRVRQHRAASAVPSAARRILTNRDKPTYKVVLEEVTQKKKKLITAGSFHANPPPGYTFIPAGDPQITNRCKDIARKDGAKVYAVSTTKHKHSGLSKEVHRIGYHFPSSVVGRACLSLGVDLSRDGRVLRHQHDWIADKARPRHQHRTRLNLLTHNTSNTKLSQATIDTQAREAIKDLFPKIPDKDLRDIVTHAFELGKARVGTAPELPLARRVQLAVVAHIRHTYTDYDNLLRQVPWNAARAMIEQASLNKLAQWRGDDDDEPDAMEDILREIIVIPDDDEEEDANGAGTSIAQSRFADRHGSVEIVASRNIADDMEMRPIDYSNLRTGTQGPESSESDDDQEVIFLGHGQYVIDRPDQARSKRNRDHRHRAWEEARDRFRYPVSQPHSPPVRPLPQAVGIASNVHVRRDSYKRIEEPPPQQHRPNDQKITCIREVQPLGNLSIDQAKHQSMADSDFRRPIYPEQARSVGPLTNPFKTVETQPTGPGMARDYQTNQYVPSHSSASTNCVYVEYEREDRVSTLRMNPTSYEQFWMPNYSNERLPQSPNSRFENVLQSIEKPTHFTTQNQQSDRPLHTDAPVEVRQFDRFETPRETVFYRQDRNVDDEQHLVKRRRINRGHDNMHDLNPIVNDLQRSLLIPVRHTDKYEFSDREPVMLHRVDGAEPSFRTERPESARAVHRIIEFDQQNMSAYRPNHTEHVSSYGIQFPRYGQVLVPQQQSSSHVSARSSVERLVQKPFPDFDERRSVQNLSYVPQSSYVSVPRQDLRTSYVNSDALNRRTAQQSPPANENVRFTRPAFGQTSGIKKYLATQDVIPQVKPQTAAGNSGVYLVRESPVEIQESRERRLLPLERSFEQLRPVRERTHNREVDKIEGPFRDDVFDQAITFKNTPRSQVPWPQTQLQYGAEQRSYDMPMHKENWWASAINYRSSITDLPYSIHKTYRYDVESQRNTHVKEVSRDIISELGRPVARVPSLGNQQRRVLDKQTRKEVVVLE
ncbi:hypothetical protein MMC18_005109 [Xylographa bjoerkii]|nr:hypothetical protein [Xylographa bjoerkii]